MNKRSLCVWVACILAVGFFLTGISLCQTKVELNKATAAQLGRCPGLNSTLAKAILEYRQKTGLFKTPEDLLKVKGITKEILEKLKPKMEKDILYVVPLPASDEDEEEPSLKPSKC
jgi:competence ComEA-like helix-hairpin-helix protein